MYLCDINNNNKVVLYSDMYRLSFKLGMLMETMKLYILISVTFSKGPVWMTLTFIQDHSCMRNQKLLLPFSGKFLIKLDGIQYVATNYWFVEAHAKFVLHNQY